MSSLFTKLYSYRQRENRHNKENFLTEILAFCLEHDLKFRSACLLHLGIKEPSGKIEVRTQSSYTDKGRPDVELRWDHAHLLIECKVEHVERKDQLKDYVAILNASNAPQKFLVYLTKYYEEKGSPDGSIPFHLMRWYEIYSRISSEMDSITLQLKDYLKEEGMHQSSEFNKDDQIALRSINYTISKMNEVLDQVKHYYHAEEELGKLSIDSRASAIRNYQSYRDFKYFTDHQGYQYTLSFGFSWGEDENVNLYLNFYFPTDRQQNKHKKYAERIGEVWTGANKTEYNGNPVVGFSKPLKDYIEKSEQIPAMVQLFKDWINQVVWLKKQLPDIVDVV